MGNKSKVSQVKAAERTELVPLADLHLDTGNPRFGGTAGNLRSEVAILDTIVEKFGVEDVLSSLAVNGYFDAEPLVGLRNKKDGGVKIVEGNRRLAACLILANDERAVNQQSRVNNAQTLQKEHDRQSINAIPVLVFEESEWKDEVLPYLGVRHIASSQPWDSYAKAAWIAQVLDKGDLTLKDVTQMIGDQHQTTPRMLEGYYFVHQLINEARFKPSDSLRKGRGSNPEYPFSWVYTALGYGPVRRWLELEELSEGKNQNPVPKKRLDDAEDFMTFLFGNKSKERQAAILDSRNIADLAKAVSDSSRRQLLKRGKSVAEVIELTRPTQERVVSGLLNAQDALSSVLVTLSEGELPTQQAKELIEPSKKVLALARDVHHRVKKAFTDLDEDGEGNA
jgi:hypothetical protein